MYPECSAQRDPLANGSDRQAMAEVASALRLLSLAVKRVRSFVRIGLLACGAALLVLAVQLDEVWFVRHVAVPAQYFSPPWWLHPLLRAVPAACGVLLILLSGPISRASAGVLVRNLLAALLACVPVELLLRRNLNGTAAWRASKLELRIGRPDPRYGWVLLPSRTTALAVAGAIPVAYAIDAWGDRADNDKGAPDTALPSLVVAGESIAVGHGLPFEQTFAALLAKRLGLQLVNVAAGGYGTDQALLRLADALPRLSHPVAVVMVVPLIQLERNLQDYRPRLELRDGALELVPPAQGTLARLRLRDVVVNELPLLSEYKLQHAIAVTAAELREAARVARAHGAEPVFLVPMVGSQHTGDARREAQFLLPLFIEQGLPFVPIDLDPSELLPFDGHPGPAASRRIAAALADALSLRFAH
jgi:hypothetical protein